MTREACIGEPISWLRLEEHALRGDPDVAAHVAACAACRACLGEIERDVVALPALPALAPPRRTRWWLGAIPALAAAALILFVLRPREAAQDDRVRIKGVGEVVLDVVRDRDGNVRDDVRTFRPGDRWKVVITCPPQAHARVEIEVRDGKTIDRPLAPIDVACGNRVVLPGAFTLDGASPDRVCARVTGGGDAGTACITIAPE